MTSSFPGFYKLSIPQRSETLLQKRHLSELAQQALQGTQPLRIEMADQMVENVVGIMGLPLGVCTNLQINGRDRLAMMAIEEASVVAAASHAAKLLRAGGGLVAESTPPIMIGQIQLTNVPNLKEAQETIQHSKEDILAQARTFSEGLIHYGGGPVDVEVRELLPIENDDPLGPMLIVHLLVHVQDAMGANAVNTICEGISPLLERLTYGKARLRILSNLADRRIVTAKGRIPFQAFCKKDQDISFGIESAKGIEEASIFAERDPYRAATHNKGIMNGVDAVLVATGQDYRAVEAGAHAYAARSGMYLALSKWRVKEDGLHGSLSMPMAVGTVGGITQVHPMVKAAFELMEINTAKDLAEIATSVGLAQNVAALRALAMEGIQQGHMRLHARNLAVEAGAIGPQIQQLADAMARQQRITPEGAKAIFQTLS